MKLKKVLESDFTINLSHIDLDGFGSSYVVEQYVQKCCNPSQLLFQYNVDYGGILDALDEMSKTCLLAEREAGLIITDLNVSAKEIERIKQLFGDNWFIFDHHVNGTMEIYNEEGHYIIDEKRCATKITFDALRAFNDTFNILENNYDANDVSTHFDNRELNIFTTTVNVYDLYLRDSFFDFNLGTWFTKCIEQCPITTLDLKRNYIYNLFRAFYNVASVKQPQIEKRFIDFQFRYIAQTWKDHKDLKEKLNQIYPDLQLIARANSIMDYLELIPINVLFAYLEYLYIQQYIVFDNSKIMVFEGINSKVLNRIYDILFIDEANRQKVMINVTSKYKDSTSFSFRSKNKKAGQTAAAIGKICGPGANGGGHDNAAGGNIKRNTTKDEYLELLCNAYEYGEREKHNESRP